MSHFEIDGATPSDVLVDDAHAKVVGCSGRVVWSKFDNPETQTPVNPMQPYKTTGASGFSLGYIPTAKNSSTAIVETPMVFDMNGFKLRVLVNVERTVNGIHQEFVRTTWRFDVSVRDSNDNVIEQLLTKTDYFYTKDSSAGLDYFVFNVGVCDTFANDEFKAYFEFKNSSTLLKRVVSTTNINSISSYTNNYPKIYSSGTGLYNVGTIDIRVAYIDE